MPSRPATTSFTRVAAVHQPRRRHLQPLMVRARARGVRPTRAGRDPQDPVPGLLQRWVACSARWSTEQRLPGAVWASPSRPPSATTCAWADSAAALARGRSWSSHGPVSACSRPMPHVSVAGCRSSSTRSWHRPARRLAAGIRRRRRCCSAGRVASAVLPHPGSLMPHYPPSAAARGRLRRHRRPAPRQGAAVPQAPEALVAALDTASTIWPRAGADSGRPRPGPPAGLLNQTHPLAEAAVTSSRKRCGQQPV